jgi:hypothetical protein
MARDLIVGIAGCHRMHWDFERNASLCAVQGRYNENMFLSVPRGTYRAYQSDRCLVFCCRSNLLLPFHGGNTGSNPVGDAKIPKKLHASGVVGPCNRM